MPGGTDGLGDPVQRVAQGSQVQVAVDAAELCLPASTIPAAHQRSAMVPSRQFLTFER